MLSDSAILKKIERQPRQTAASKQLVRELGLHGDQRRDLRDHLQALVKRGQLLEIDSGRFAIPKAAAGKNLVVGQLSLHRDGFGFVTPDPVSLAQRFKVQLSGDVFIPPPFIGQAMHADRVLVEISKIGPDGRAEGRILRTVHRANRTVVGIFHYGRNHNYVVPIDQKVASEIIIPSGSELPQRSEAPKKTEHRVIGKEAASRARWDDLENVVVDVEITDWPTATQSARGRVIEVIGYADDFGVDVEI